jgi:hypothetical protein
MGPSLGISISIHSLEVIGKWSQGGWNSCMGTSKGFNLRIYRGERRGGVD